MGNQTKKTEFAKHPNGKIVSRPAVILVDLNGTLIAESWGASGTWLQGAQEALRAFLKAGYTVRVHSLVHHSKEFDTVHDRGYGEREKSLAETRAFLDTAGLQEVKIEVEDKIPAMWIVDDRAIGFRGNWRKVVREVLGNSS